MTSLVVKYPTHGGALCRSLTRIFCRIFLSDCFAYSGLRPATDGAYQGDRARAYACLVGPGRPPFLAVRGDNVRYSGLHSGSTAPTMAPSHAYAHRLGRRGKAAGNPWQTAPSS